MKKRDPRYGVVKKYIEDGSIKTFEEIFEYFPKTKLAEDIGWHSERMTDFIKDVNLLRLETMDKVADVFDVKYSSVSELAHAQFVQTIKGKPRKIRKDKDQ